MSDESLYGAPVHWLEQVVEAPEEPLRQDLEVDVAIIGGGFTGLWTAYELKLAEPGLEVAILESWEIAHGASGRNGGFAMTLLDMSLAHLLKNYGADAARAAHEAVAESVDAIGAVCTEHSIACDYHKGGLLEVATNPGQERRITADLEAADAMGLQGFTPLTGDQCRERVQSPTYRMGFHEEACAVLQPAALARGLKRLVISLGVHVFEQTPVVAVDRSGPGAATVVTETHRLRADRVVLTTNAWTKDFRDFRRKVIPLYTYILMTEPLTDAQWASVGWDGREGVEDKRNYVHYYRPTADRRILWGGSDGVIYRGTSIRPRHDTHAGVFAHLESTFRRTFPQLADVGFSHRWGGPVAITVPFVPYFGTLGGGQLSYGFGYNGHGVAPSHTGARILRDLVLDRRSRYTDLLFVDTDEKRFPPAPVLWLGAELTRRMLLRQDRRMEAGRDAGDMDPLLLRWLRNF